MATNQPDEAASPLDPSRTVKEENEMAADDPRRKENRPAAGLIPTRNAGVPNTTTPTAPARPVPAGPTT